LIRDQSPAAAIAGAFAMLSATFHSVRSFWKTLLLAAIGLTWFGQPSPAEDKPVKPINLSPPPIAGDKSVKYDYDIVYVRIARDGHKPKVWAQAGVPLQMNPGADLMLLHPDGSEEVLVPAGKGSVTDPMVSFDGQSVYYSHFEDLSKFTHGMAPTSADIFKIHVPTRKIVRLTNGGFSPNTGVADWDLSNPPSGSGKQPPAGKTSAPYPVCNM